MIHVTKEYGLYEVWTDCEEGDEHSGRIVGSDKSEEEALRQAYHELAEDMKQVEKRIADLGTSSPEIDRQ